ncbi:Bifunctional inhibitor/plant lipid transfer protein/seed storage helical domain [Arabidopsis suecica]|uniref:Bifunctional inhibitor/plant lipid transfer protein/seed storage helical domain n=1 Tax=Arabidopsis suecica TaxID=45249 RepID=A0A8T2EF92_ARASU|nr:Bifunctional inhibitor/plant lipid transfer protein/seed storage helical domain [Arabidopsis suecica]
MANKLFLVCAALALCFILTNASVYRTVVEFDEDDASNPIGPIQKCQKEFQQEQHLRACQRWMRKQMWQGRGGGPSLDDEFDMEDDIENPQRRQLLQKCCSELRQEEPVCVCPTLRQAAKAVRFQGQQHQPEQVRKIYQAAKYLPNICKIQQVGICPFQIPSIPSYY